jgi:hypothetical protein
LQNLAFYKNVILSVAKNSKVQGLEIFHFVQDDKATSFSISSPLFHH